MIRRINAHLRRLPIGLYGALCSSFCFGGDTLILVATGASIGTALRTGLACGVGGGFGAAIGRDRRVQWRNRLMGRFAKPS